MAKISVGNGCKVGFVAAPVGEGVSDLKLYDEVLHDCEHGHKVGYDSVWMLEHHFTDYFPVPSPLMFLAHVAATMPTLSLGTSVAVSPWYNPIRLAGEISMLAHLTKGHLHIGLGRGTAKLEYDAFGIDMSEARDRFAENQAIIDALLTDRNATFDGKFTQMKRAVSLRPAPAPVLDRIHLYGAVGSPESSEVMADLNLPLLSIASFPVETQQKIVNRWRARMTELGREHRKATLPMTAFCFVGDTDEEAIAIAKRYLPPMFQLQVKHYESDANHWATLPGYEQHSRFFANLKRLADPDTMDGWLQFQLVGSAETVARRLQAYIDAGFGYFILQTTTPTIPRSVRHEALSRFAAEVAPLLQGQSAAA